ncbi:hypothetical protein U1Q18_031070, partial [Sarracenia purpurea var. burkii]
MLETRKEGLIRGSNSQSEGSPRVVPGPVEGSSPMGGLRCDIPIVEDELNEEDGEEDSAEGSGKSQERAEVNAESENIDKDTETEVVTEKLQGVDKCNLGIEKVPEKALSPIPIDEVHEVMSDQEEVSLTPKSAQQSPKGPPDKRSTS